MDDIVQVEFSPTLRYSFTQEFLSTRSSSVNFASNIPIHVYQQQEFPTYVSYSF